MSIAAIILAAGSSSRLGRPKQLLLINGEAMLQRAFRCATEAGATPIVVVLGAHRELIQTSIDLTGTVVVANDDWREGLASSIRAGVRAVENNASAAEGLLLMTCDQPRVTSEHLHRLIQTSRAQSIATAVASTYGEIRGIPAVFPRQAAIDLLALHGDHGARALLQSPPWPVIEVPLVGGEVDIDTPQDLSQLR